VEVEATSVESSEYDGSDVKALGKVLHNAGEGWFWVLGLLVTCLKGLKEGFGCFVGLRGS
jgi:hypothetical protein